MKMLFKKRKNLFLFGLPLALAAYIFSGCASTGGSKETVPPGTLTVTGIPAEYNGKFVRVFIMSIPDFSAKVQSSGAFANAEDRTIKGADRYYIAIKGDKLELPIYASKAFGLGNGYAGNDTADVRLQISDKAGYGFPILQDAIIVSVVFEAGVTEANWEDALKADSITVTNVPAEYVGTAGIVVGQGIKKNVFGQFYLETAIVYGSGPVLNGTITALVLPPRTSSGYTPFPEGGTADVLVSLKAPSGDKQVATGVTVEAPPHAFLFKNVQIAGGKAALDFRKGVRQQ